MVRRGERLLRRHLGEITMPSRGRGCLRTNLEAVSTTPNYISSLPRVQTLQFLLDNDIHVLPYMLNFSLESLKTVKRLVVDNLCKSTQVHCAVNSAN